MTKGILFSTNVLHPSDWHAGENDVPFTIHFYACEGTGEGFTIPHPQRDGTINVRTTKVTENPKIVGATASDILWLITLYVQGSLGGSTKAVISDGNALATTSPVHDYNEKEKEFNSLPGRDGSLSCSHCCRSKDFIDITVTTTWASARRKVTIDSNAQILF